MIFTTDSFSAIESLLEKHAPILLRIGASEGLHSPDSRVIGPWRPPIAAHTVARMKRLRLQGKTIGTIARICRVSWRTAWLRSKD